MAEANQDAAIVDRSEVGDDPGRSPRSTGFLVLLVIGGLLIAGAAVTATLAVMAERGLADEERAVSDREADAADVRAELSDVRDLDVQIQDLAAQQPELRAAVAESWNALVEQADVATRAITRSIRSSNDGDTDSATAILDTEVRAAVEASQGHRETLSGAAEALAAAVDDLRTAIDEAEQR